MIQNDHVRDSFDNIFCRRFHHTLLHINPRLLDKFLASSRSQSPPSRSMSSRNTHASTSSSGKDKTSSSASLTSILRPNGTHARCLLDSGSTVSRVSKNLVGQRLETFCIIVLKSRFDSTSKIDGKFRVDNRIALKTPSQSPPKTYKKNFRDLFLADSEFYESASIDSYWS